MIIDDMLTKIEDLDIDHDSSVAHKLRDLIKESYSYLIHNEGFSDWQKLRISQAIIAWHYKYYYLSRVALLQVFEDSEKISKEEWHTKHLKKAADSIDLRLLIKAINKQ